MAVAKLGVRSEELIVGASRLDNGSSLCDNNFQLLTPHSSLILIAMRRRKEMSI